MIRDPVTFAETIIKKRCRQCIYADAEVICAECNKCVCLDCSDYVASPDNRIELGDIPTLCLSCLEYFDKSVYW